MANVQALRKDAAPPPPRSPEREQLRQAIARRDEAAHRLAALNAALERADAASTFRAVKQARVALEDATASERRNLVAVALGNPDVGASIDEARAALTKAESDYAAAKKVADALKTEQARAEDDLKWATRGLDDAVRSVLQAAPEVVQLQADVEVAKRTLAAAIDKLLTLPISQSVAWDIGTLLSRRPDPAWAAAVEQLRGDADIRLPSS